MSTNYHLISHSYSSIPHYASNYAFSHSQPSPISEYSSSSSASSYAYSQPSPSDSSSPQSCRTSQAQKKNSLDTYVEPPKFPTPPFERAPFTYETFNFEFNAGASQFHDSVTSQCHSDFNTSGSKSFVSNSDPFGASLDLNVCDSFSNTTDSNSGTSSADSSPSPTGASSRTGTTGPLRFHVAHPYARLVPKKNDTRRKIWNHVLEKSLFTPFEMLVFFLLHLTFFLFCSNKKFNIQIDPWCTNTKGGIHRQSGGAYRYAACPAIGVRLELFLFKSVPFNDSDFHSN